MKVVDLYKKSISVVFQNPSVTLFLVLYLILSSVFTSYMFSSRVKIIALILSFCVFLFSLCFVSGWFQIIKEASEDEKNNKNYLGIFLEGIGKNIISVGIGSFIYLLLLTIVFFIVGKIAYSVFGSLDFILKDLMTITQDNNALVEYFNRLTVDQKYIIYSWQLSFIFASMVYNFLMIFYFPAIIFEKNKNVFLKPFIAFKNSILVLFKNFFSALGLYFLIYVIYMFLGISKALFSSNVIISILILFVYIYFISASIMLIFKYYGQKINSSDRCDCIRENEDINKSSEEN